MKQPDRFLFNLALCLDELEISHSGLGLLMQDLYQLELDVKWSQTDQAAQRRARRLVQGQTDAHLRDIEDFGRVLEIDPAVLAFGDLDELRAALYHEE